MGLVINTFLLGQSRRAYRRQGAGPKCCKSNWQFSSSLDLNGKIACEPQSRCGKLCAPLLKTSSLGGYTYTNIHMYTLVQSIFSYAYMVAKGNKLSVVYRLDKVGYKPRRNPLIERASSVSCLQIKISTIIINLTMLCSSAIILSGFKI